MQYLTETRFRKKAALIALVSCTVLQIFSIVIRYIYQYSVSGNISYGTWGSVISIAAEFIGYISVFSGYAVITYLVFLYGLRGGGEWTIALIAGYALVYFLVFFIGDFTFGVIASALITILLAAVYLIWTKGCRGISALIFATMLIPYIGALVILFSTTVVSAEMLLTNVIYGLLNLGTDFLIIIVIARIADFFRKKAIQKGEGTADISIGRKLLPHGNPVLRAFLTADIVYAAVAAVSAVIETADLLAEYGAPVSAGEWFTLLSPYLTLAVYFVVGYAVMVFIAIRLEAAFISSDDEATVETGKKRSGSLR